jgi:16S rRNA (cytidine1402-2'-O)-methyltransferase
MQKGILYIISTPLGNIKDITLRSLDILKSVAVVLSEDTRETQKIFKEYNINKPQISYRDQNHSRVAAHIESLLTSGNNLALVSDSGTPLISDPGFKLVRDILDSGFEVVSVPGPSSVIAALTVSGLPTDKFTFLGFLPKTTGARLQLIKENGVLDNTLIIFESPFRVQKLLEEVLSALGDRKCAVVAELTKTYERVYRGKVSEVLEKLAKEKVRGEFVVLIAKEDL